MLYTEESSIGHTHTISIHVGYFLDIIGLHHWQVRSARLVLNQKLTFPPGNVPPTGVGNIAHLLSSLHTKQNNQYQPWPPTAVVRPLMMDGIATNFGFCPAVFDSSCINTFQGRIQKGLDRAYDTTKGHTSH